MSGEVHDTRSCASLQHTDAVLSQMLVDSVQIQALSGTLQGAAAVAKCSATGQRLAASLEATHSRSTPHGMLKPL